MLTVLTLNYASNWDLEPGGLFWYETLNLLKYIFKSSNVVGADINELAPIKGFKSYKFFSSKISL